MFKKAMSLVLSLILTIAVLIPSNVSVYASDSVYVVTGVQELCGSPWNPSDVNNVMTKTEEGTYIKVYTNVAVMNDYAFKIVEDESNWYGNEGSSDNFMFNVTSICDVTVTFYPDTKKIEVTGDGVVIPTELDIEAMYVAGNGEGNWLNGISWNPAAEKNIMAEVEPNIYEVKYYGISKSDNYQVKFVANGSWANNWAGTYSGSGVETDAVFDPLNSIIFDVPYETADVVLRIDLNDYVHTTKQGAKFTITVIGFNEYDVTVTDGTASVDEGTPITKVTEGTTVTLTADAAPEGKVFDKWVVESGDITLADANSTTTTFTMPAGEVIVKATYKVVQVTYNLTTQVSGGHGTISESKTELTEGSTETVIFYPDEGYEIDTVTVNGVETGVLSNVLNVTMDTNKTVIVTYKEVSHTHNLTHIPAKPATVTETGNKEYWYCKECDKYFSDEEGKNSIELEDTVIAKLTKGWKKNATGWWYDNGDGTYPKSEWKSIDGSWYYFNESGYMATGWKEIDGKWYFLESNGKMAANKWVNSIYYVKSNGEMAVSEWVDGGKYYVDANGKWVPNKTKAEWKKDTKGWWYDNGDGTYPKSEWKSIDGAWYYFNASGYMATGWLMYNGSWYYLESNGKMAADKWVDGGKYYVDANGKWVPGKTA